MTSKDEQGRPNCDACKFKKTGKNKAYFNMDPCRKGHSVFFTCCVIDCKDFQLKDAYIVENKHEESGVQQEGN